MVMERLGILEGRLARLLQQLRETRERARALEERVRGLEAEAGGGGGKSPSRDARLRELSNENEMLRAQQEAVRQRVERLLGALGTIPGLRETKVRRRRTERQ